MQVRYIYTQIAYSQLAQSDFEEAGNNFFRAETDARALIRLFPDLCDGLPEFSRQDETMPIFRGLEDVVRNAGNVEETGKLSAYFLTCFGLSSLSSSGLLRSTFFVSPIDLWIRI